LAVPVLPLLNPLESIAHGHDFLLAENGVHRLSGNTDSVVVDANPQPQPLLQVFPLLGFGGQLLNGEAHAGPAFVPARIDQRWSLDFVSDVLAPGVSPMAESREHGGATYAVA
jgi:hypothetical protein